MKNCSFWHMFLTSLMDSLSLYRSLNLLLFFCRQLLIAVGNLGYMMYIQQDLSMLRNLQLCMLYRRYYLLSVYIFLIPEYSLRHIVYSLM